METKHINPTFDISTTAQAHLELSTRFLEQRFDQWPRVPESASDWWCLMFPEQVRVYGCPFLEQHRTDGLGITTTSPISANLDCLAACLGGDERLGHKVIYYPPELQFYYYDPRDQMFHATTDQKLQNLFRGFLSRCAEAVKGDAAIFSLFHTLRTDQTVKAVVNRCKSILAASHDFFGVSSPHQRVQGPEIHERIGRIFIESVLEREEGSILTLAKVYAMFCSFVKERNMPVLKRSQFKGMFGDLVRDEYGLGLRNDLINEVTQKQTCGWRGLKLGVPAAA